MTPQMKPKPLEFPAPYPLGGDIVITFGVVTEIGPDDVFGALKRHADGDYGECDPADAEANSRALSEGEGRIVSVFDSRQGVRFWIITEADRSVTTVLLPEEY